MSFNNRETLQRTTYIHISFNHRPFVKVTNQREHVRQFVWIAVNGSFDTE